MRKARLLRRAILVVASVAALLGAVHVAQPVAVRPGVLALNYVQNSPRISSAGMPARRQFAAIADAGFDVVVNLAPSQALGAHQDEQTLVEQRGMRYFNIPVNFDSPRREDFERFARILRDNGGKRTLVHCQLNLRASTFVFLYRVVELGEDPDRAFDDVERVWLPSAQWREFIREILAASGKPLPLQLES
jgi:protein tyrosine phosphatase (PTP) superfamily phosphohydrolase (DUF442 family)